MAGKKKMGDKWQYTFKRSGVLDKPLYITFSSEDEGDAYAARLDSLLDRGIVPTEYQSNLRILKLSDLVRQYLRDANPTQKDIDVLSTVVRMVGDHPITLVNVNWVDGWITSMKRVGKLSPATIRAKVGALARCTDWGVRKGMLLMPDRPLRSLPEGYAQYTKLDGQISGAAKSDVERDRRLESGEEQKILSVIDRGTLDRKQRPYTIEHVDSVRVIFTLAIETAMRLREIYTLTTDQVSLQKRTVFLDKTKNGDKRQVPLSSVAIDLLKNYIESNHASEVGVGCILFPLWSGSYEPKELRLQSNYLSKLYRNIFHDAGCVDLHFHDLRHEATSRLFERTSLSEAKIMKITGHKSHKMMMRYANLRGSDLADELW